MKENLAKAICFILLASFNLSAHGEEKPMDLAKLAKTPFWVDYQKALDQLRDKYKLDEVQLREAIMRCQYTEQVFLKSGIGDIGNGEYERVVQNNLSVNNIEFKGKRKQERLWKGESYDVPELVLLEGDRVVYSKRYGGGEPSRDFTLVLFMPGRVEYLSWRDFRGGWFKRWPKSNESCPQCEMQKRKAASGDP